MSHPPASAAKVQRGKRHPLLFHQALNEQIFWPSILVVALTAAMLVWTPPGYEPYRGYLRLVLATTGLLLVLTLVFRLRSYVQCRADGLHVQLPFYHLHIAYRQIRTVRPTELYRLFPPDEQTWSQRRFLRNVSAEAVIAVELEHLPRSKHWLRLWTSKYMLCPDRVGLVLAVRDWIALRTELDELKARSQQRTVRT